MQWIRLSSSRNPLQLFVARSEERSSQDSPTLSCTALRAALFLCWPLHTKNSDPNTGSIETSDFLCGHRRKRTPARRMRTLLRPTRQSVRFRSNRCPLSLELLSAFVRIRVRFTSGSAAKWRKMKGVCEIRLRSGLVVNAELHWYEAHGIGRKEFKVKRLLE